MGKPNRLFLNLGAAAVLATCSTGALAMSESCEKEFSTLMKQRQAHIDKINGYNKRKPTASQACSTFRQLAVENQKLLTWMTDQKDWCQIPEEMPKQFTEGNASVPQTRDRICGQAAQQARQQRQAQQGARQPQQPGVGSGVKLPQGAL